VADKFNNAIRKIGPSDSHPVTTLAGNGSSVGYKDEKGTAAQFNEPAGVAVDAAGNVYVADRNNNCIRKITSDGAVTTFAGKGPDNPGYVDAIKGSDAKFKGPSDVAIDAAGNIYVVDSGNNRVRKITPEGEVSTLAGNGEAGFLDDETFGGSSAKFNYPTGIAVDANGNVYVADQGNNRIRKITFE
jgi:sugar lactone lactonase YvrE